MQCEDNSKLRIPLSEVCQTTDIGCVPITNGKPGCNPQPDELPIAFDPSTNTLWLFSCDTREWIAMTKFQMCQLSALNLDNIRNICDILNIGVYFDAGSGCQQGTVTLGELAEKILECLKLETKIITIGQGDGNKVKISIDGLPLDPVYVTGNNIWSEGGSGTESDPLVVATYDPICKWPIKNRSEVDAATTKHLGACLDGEMARVSFPSKICELPPKNQAQVDAAQSVELAACVDGQEAKIPYIKPSPPVCEANQITLEQAKQRGSNLTIVGCDTGRVIRIPVSQSGFFDRDYICVPEVSGVPSGVPAPGTGPLRVDCDGGLYVWLCDSNKWLRVRDGIEGLSQLNANNVPDICNNFRMKGWYSNNSDPCVQDVWLTLKQLSELIVSCQDTIINDNIYIGNPFYVGGCNSVEGIGSPTILNHYFAGRDEYPAHVADFSTDIRLPGEWSSAGRTSGIFNYGIKFYPGNNATRVLLKNPYNVKSFGVINATANAVVSDSGDVRGAFVITAQEGAYRSFSGWGDQYEHMMILSPGNHDYTYTYFLWGNGSIVGDSAIGWGVIDSRKGWIYKTVLQPNEEKYIYINIIALMSPKIVINDRSAGNFSWDVPEITEAEIAARMNERGWERDQAYKSLQWEKWPRYTWHYSMFFTPIVFRGQSAR